jgi:hypothetical protein
MSRSDREPPPRIIDPFVALTDEATQQRAIQARAEARSRREVAAAVATWIGTLRDLAESGRVVTVLTGSGRAHRGTLVAVGVDHVAIAGDPDGTALVRLDMVRAVRPEAVPDVPPAMGDRSWSQDRDLHAWLERLLELGWRVGLVLDGAADALHGQLVTLGEDVVTLRLDGRDRGLVYVGVAAVAEVLLAGRVGGPGR